MDLKKLSFKILDPKDVVDKVTTEEVYAVWKKTWKDVFTEVGSPQAFNPDTFFRAERIPVLFCGDTVVGFFLAGVYPLRSSVVVDHSYFSIFPKDVAENLSMLGIDRAMSFEFLTVVPAFRKPEIGVSLSPVLIGLGLKLMVELGCGVSLGVARKSKKIDVFSHEFGCETLSIEARRGNLVCEIVGFYPDQVRKYPDIQIQSLIETLWRSRLRNSLTKQTAA